MKIPHFKKGLQVQFVEAATDFIDHQHKTFYGDMVRFSFKLSLSMVLFPTL